MHITIAHLGPIGTYSETAALRFAQAQSGEPVLRPYSNITQTLTAVVERQTQLAVVPIENSVEGGVIMTLDTLWQLEQLHVQQALVLPIRHTLITQAATLTDIRRVYSHPQGIAQCQRWLAQHLPQVELIPANSTTANLQDVKGDPTVAVISSQRAAELYDLPVLVSPINDHPDNCTRFLLLGLGPSPGGSITSLAFSLRANQPGTLVDMLHIFADRNINLNRIESRPTKRSMGDYLFFVDLEADARDVLTQAALTDLAAQTETLKIFGSYDLLPDR
jgi:prephenate dehydratase